MQLEFNYTYFIIFSLTCFIATFFAAKYSKFLFRGFLLDKDFLKPQAFHEEPTARIGGFTILLFDSWSIFKRLLYSNFIIIYLRFLR